VVTRRDDRTVAGHGGIGAWSCEVDRCPYVRSLRTLNLVTAAAAECKACLASTALPPRAYVTALSGAASSSIFESVGAVCDTGCSRRPSTSLFLACEL